MDVPKQDIVHPESKIIQPITQHLKNVTAIYLFGSYGTVYETPDSDVDVAILASQKIQFDDRLQIINALITSLHREKIDLIDLRNSPTVLKFQIIMNGKIIFCADSYQLDFFEMVTLSSYVRLNGERQGILEAIQQRGSVY